MDRTPTPSRRQQASRYTTGRAQSACQAALLVWLTAVCPGCINIFAMTAKVFMGDPKIVSTFERRTNLKLQDGSRKLAIVIDAPYGAYQDDDSIDRDIQERLEQRLRREGIRVINDAEVERALERSGGTFSAAAIAKVTEVDVIAHIRIETLSQRENGDPNLYRGQAQGLVTCYEVRGERDTPGRHVVQIYEEPFQVGYPSVHPVPTDQTPIRNLRRGFINRLAEEIGRQFYDVTTSDTFKGT